MKDANPPRFVPILTEVVEAASPPAADTATGPASEPLPAASIPGTQDELARQVVARVLDELEPLVLEALRTVQAQQARSLEVLVRTELATRVARLVGDARVRPQGTD